MTEEQIKQTEEWAELFFDNGELARLLGITEADVDLAMQTPDSPLGSAIQRGRLLSEAEVRRSIITLAKQGSGPAQTEALRLIRRIAT